VYLLTCHSACILDYLWVSLNGVMLVSVNALLAEFIIMLLVVCLCTGQVCRSCCSGTWIVDLGQYCCWTSLLGSRMI
jgi:hypothetical protein